MASRSEDKCKGSLNTPLHFQKAKKHNLIPPSTFSNQKLLPANVKIPSDFSLKSSNSKEKEKGNLNANPSSLTGVQSTSSEVIGSENISSCHLKSTDITGNPSAHIRPPNMKMLPPGLSLPNFQGASVCGRQLEQNDENVIGNLDFHSGDDDTVSKKAYKKLEDMYVESKNKLDNLEMRFFKIMKAAGKEKIQNSGKHQNEAEDRLIKQLEAFKFQNEFLCDKLQKLQHGDVKGAVDRYLSQNQFETEKITLNNKILELERNLFEKTKENETLVKDVAERDSKYEKAMARNNQERYSYEECMAKLNAKISEMMDENEKLSKEKEDILGKYEDSLKIVNDTNQIMETKNKCIEALSSKILQEENKNKDLSKKIEKERETFESALGNVEKMLKDEVINNSNRNDEIKENEGHIKLLENKLDEMKMFTHELQHDNDQIKTLRKHVDLKCEEIFQLQESCRTLQSANETLNIRVNCLCEMLRMQEPYISGDKEKLLIMWREKVYSLLVLLKVQEMKSRRCIAESYFDGASTL